MSLSDSRLSAIDSSNSFGKLGNNIIEGRAAVVVGANFDGGNASFTFSGSANQTFTNNGGANLTGTWIIDKTGGTVTAAHPHRCVSAAAGADPFGGQRSARRG